MDKQKINVTKSSVPPMEEYFDEIRELWDSCWLTNNGVKHRQLEKELSEYLDVPFATLFVNGHCALEMALEVMDLEGEVITTPFTFASTTHAIVRNGLTPVFCDINPDTYTIDADKIEALITDKTCAILPVHVYGNVCDVEKIEQIAKKHNLKVIYDAAHAFGVTYKGKGIASFGDASMFSFHATKVFNTIEGGAVTYSDESLCDKLKNVKNFGITGTETVDYVGGNAKMNEFSAAMGICNLRHIEEEIAKRKAVVEWYNQRLSGVCGLKLMSAQEDVKINYAYYPVVFDGYKYNRDEICEKLKERGIVSRKYFYPLATDFGCYKYSSDNLPVAKHVSDRVLTLPLYASLTKEDVDRICDIILEV